jgi:hypothetical protein
LSVTDLVANAIRPRRFAVLLNRNDRKSALMRAHEWAHPHRDVPLETCKARSSTCNLHDGNPDRLGWACIRLTVMLSEVSSYNTENASGTPRATEACMGSES